MTSSIALKPNADAQYVLRLADTCLVWSHRLSEWCGHAPVLEEDIALANHALDLLGQARALLTRAGQLEGQGFDEDQLAYLRDERDFVNVTLAELPNGTNGRGDFAFTVLRNFVLSSWALLMWQHLAPSRDAELAAIASKLGKLPTVAEYQEAMGIINKDSASVYRYLNFDQIEEYAETAKSVTV